MRLPSVKAAEANLEHLIGPEAVTVLLEASRLGDVTLTEYSG